ncbi:MAG: hypothetical protein U0228_21220 [Myxococcaceae bacterium]
MSRQMRTIGLWVVLMVLFVAFYQFFSSEPAAGHDVAPAANTERTSLWSVLSSWLPIVFLFLFFVFFMRRVNARNQVTNDGIQLLWAGRYLQALEIFEQERAKDPKQPVHVFNAGSAKLQLWKLGAAAADFEATSKLVVKGKEGALATILPEHLGLTFALLGRTGEAWKCVKEMPVAPTESGRRLLTEGVLLAREGNFSEARRKLGAFEVKQLSGTIGALARTVDALCIEKTNGELRHVDRVALFGEAAPDELERGWPELVDFVKRAPAW